MKKLLLALCLFLPLCASAQTYLQPPLPVSGIITASAASCMTNVASAGCLNQPLNAATSYVGISFTGTWSGTLLVRASADHGTTWTQLDSVTTNKQVIYSVAGYTDIDVRCSSYASGTVSVFFNPSTAFSGTTLESITVPVITTGSGTSISSTAICSSTTCPAGRYVINGYIDITTACGTSGTYVVDIIYTDDAASKSVPLNIQGSGSTVATGSLDTTATTHFGQASQVFYSTGAAGINYSTTAGACGSAGPMVGNLYLTLQRIS